MTNQRLLERQVALLDYLTSTRAIFGLDGSAATDSRFHGFDVGRLRQEAMFSYDKRVAKIAAVFAKTWEYLGQNRTALLRRFVDAYPPASIGRLDNAQQFFDFLCEEWRREPPEAAYLPDIAACELAMAKVRSHTADILSEYEGPRPALRRHPGVERLICSHNIGLLFVEPSLATKPRKHTTRLAIVMPVESDAPRIFEVPDAVFSVLGKLDDWVPLAAIPADPVVRAIFDELAHTGLVEVSA